MEKETGALVEFLGIWTFSLVTTWKKPIIASLCTALEAWEMTPITGHQQQGSHRQGKCAQ